MKKQLFVCSCFLFSFFMLPERQEMFCSESTNQKWSQIAGKLDKKKTLRKKMFFFHSLI